jgi:hypothetical protein
VASSDVIEVKRHADLGTAKLYCILATEVNDWVGKCTA